MALTILDIAKLSGVSTGTVSNVLNNSVKVSSKTKSKVIRVINEVGYIPNVHARRLQKGKTGCIGILFSPFVNNTILDSFYLKVFCEMNIAVKEKGNALTYAYISDEMLKEKIFPEFIRARSVDRLIILNCIYDREYLFELKRMGFPIVLIDDLIENSGFTCIYPDNKKGAKELTEYLINLGHEYIGFIDGPNEYAYNRDRFEGYREILNESGIKLNTNFVENVKQFSMAEGYHATKRLLNKEKRLTAIFCVCDDLAIGAMRAAQEMEYRVPQDLSIVGFDDLEVSQFLNPPLTTVRIPRETIGRLAIETITNNTEQSYIQKREKNKIIVTVKLVIRNSCTIPKKQNS